MMKNTLSIICFLMLSATGFSVHAQYKVAADTVKHDKEYIEVSNDIATITGRLTVVENNMHQYQSKAKDAASDAQDAAVSSSEQAGKAAEG